MVLPHLGLDRAIQPGATMDDIRLSMRIVTEYTAWVDPTPCSGVLNAVSHIGDDNMQAATGLGMAALPGLLGKLNKIPIIKLGVDKAFSKLDDLFGAAAAKVKCWLGGNCFVAGTPVLVPGTNGQAMLLGAGVVQAEGETRPILYILVGSIVVGVVIIDERKKVGSPNRRRRLEDEVFGPDWRLPGAEDDEESVDAAGICELSAKIPDTMFPEVQMNRGFVVEFNSPERIAAAGALCDPLRDDLSGDVESSWIGMDSSHDRQAASMAAAMVRPAPASPCGTVFEFADRFVTPIGPAEAVTKKSPCAQKTTTNGERTARRRWQRMRTIFGLVLAVGLLGRGLWSAGHSVPEAKPASVALIPASVAIEDIRVGQRVVTAGIDDGNGETIVDPPTWRLLHIQARMVMPGGRLDVVDVQTLQPIEEIERIGATFGATVPVPVDLKELQLPEDLQGVVTANEPCPPIQAGPGRVVLMTINHLNPAVLELSLHGGNGQSEIVRATGPHRFFSETRTDWVAAEDLDVGEQLRGIAGPVTVASIKPFPGVHRVYNMSVTVASIKPFPGVHRVYNMSVETEHVYRISTLGTLVHNTYPNLPDPPSAAPGKRPGTRGHPDHQADVQGPGRAQAEAQARPGETVLTEKPVMGHDGINRRADNQVVGPDGKTRVVVESERRPNGPYNKARTEELEGAGIEVQTRPIPPQPN